MFLANLARLASISLKVCQVRQKTTSLQLSEPAQLVGSIAFNPHALTRPAITNLSNSCLFSLFRTDTRRELATPYLGELEVNSLQVTVSILS